MKEVKILQRDETLELRTSDLNYCNSVCISIHSVCKGFLQCFCGIFSQRGVISCYIIVT